MTTAPPSNAPWVLGRKLPPLGLAYVGAALEKSGHKVEILDNYLLKKSTEEVKQMITKLEPEIVGITCGSATYRRCIETAQAVKEVRPNCRVVVGGWHASYAPDSLLQHPEVDYVVIGEGEQAISELAAAVTKGEDQKAVESIAGVGYRRNGKLIKNPAEFISNLDEVPFPARHLLPMNLYGRRIEYLNVEPVDIMTITRGCPYNCAYCDIEKLWGKKCRMFSPRRIVDEVKHLADNYGSKGVYFISDNFTIRKTATMEFCELLKKEKLDLEWVCDTRADLLSRDLLKAMRQAGCKTIWFGVESGSPRIIDIINKGITKEQTVKAFKLCREEGIQVACSFMIGIPGETVEDMEASLKFAKQLNPDWCGFNIYVAYPGSILYEEILEKHLYDHVEDFLFYVKTKDFDFDALVEIQKRFHMSWNKSPKRILRKVQREGALNVMKQVLRRPQAPAPQ
ncbi:MAG: B12-binding domain-containing radical SAM protein [Candidatus Bathyarchaeota archaeon]|nr:B12-binding domain-containing radical SAM protein [Candidatus Bathyarchaeota archaeon]